MHALKVIKIKQLYFYMQKIINCKVQHSMRMSAAPLKAWLILNNDGAIKTGHCTCLAGAGEVCSHVAAIAFVLEIGNRKPETPACTDKLSQWTVPNLSRKIEPKPMKNVNWGNAITTKAYNGKKFINCSVL